MSWYGACFRNVYIYNSEVSTNFHILFLQLFFMSIALPRDGIHLGVRYLAYNIQMTPEETIVKNTPEEHPVFYDEKLGILIK